MSVKNQVLIAGPVRAGKTQYLGALKVAADRTPNEADPVRCHVLRMNEAMDALDNLTRRSLVRGSGGDGAGAAGLPATTQVREYSFEFECDADAPKGLFGGGGPTQFRLLDGPGGVEIGPHGGRHDRDENARKLRQAVLECGRKSQGLLLCVDSSDEDRAGDFFQYLGNLFRDIGTTPLPFRRVVVLLTKADRYFAGLALRTSRRDEAAAASLARAADPWPRARLLLTRDGVGALRKATAAGTQIACGWCSVTKAPR
jgi:hypothetical protein